MLLINRIKPSKIFCLLILTIFCLGCQNEDDGEDLEVPAYALVDEEFLPFITDFVTEASARGVTLAVDSVEIRYVDVFSTTRDASRSDDCGAVWIGYQGTGIIRIEVLRSATCWYDRSYIQKENLIFHQLGHALLNRPDINHTLGSGVPKSIMCGGYCDIYNVYSDVPVMRDYYLNELFDDTTPSPDWLNPENFVKTAWSGEDHDQNMVGWQWGLVSDIDNESGYSFFFEPAGVFPTPSIGLTVENMPMAGSAFKAGRTFDIPEFDGEGCMSLKVTADAKTVGLMRYAHIRLTVSSDLPEYEGFLRNINSYVWLEEGQDHKLEAIIHCLPPEINRGSVFVRIIPNVQSTMFVDNIQVEFWN